MKPLLLLIAVVALAAAGYYYYNSLRKGPEYALLQAASAVQKHDLVAFERYVDIDALTGHLVDEASSASQSTAFTALVPGGGLALRGGLRLLKPQLTKAAHNEVQRYVETGSLEAAQAAAPKRLLNISFLGLAGRVVSSDSKFKDIKYTTEKGDEALMGLEFAQPRYDTTMVIEVKLLRQADGHWQAKQITNTGELLQQAARLEGKHLLGGN